MQWVHHQVIAWNAGKLSELRETALMKAGFVIDGQADKLRQNQEKWMEHFENLKKYKARNGRFPPRNQCGLGNFLRKNREHLNKWNETGKYYGGPNVIAEERYEKLKSIGAIAW